MMKKGLSVKKFAICLITVIIIVSLVFCFTKPIMHKQFQIGVVEYLIKINTDGSTDVTKQTTTTILQEKN